MNQNYVIEKEMTCALEFKTETGDVRYNDTRIRSFSGSIISFSSFSSSSCFKGKGRVEELSKLEVVVDDETLAFCKPEMSRWALLSPDMEEEND